MKVRHIDDDHRYQVQQIPVDQPLFEDIRAWLVEQATTQHLETLLAHADDGVIWGRVQDGALLTSRDAFPERDVSPPLRTSTLRQARLFGSEGELLIWRTDAGWKSRQITDGIGEPVEVIDEWQILWGTRVVDANQGFTLVADGSLGHFHAPPLSIPIDAFKGGNQRPVRLQIRHYLQQDADTGLMRIALSRLVRVMTEEELRKETPHDLA